MHTITTTDVPTLPNKAKTAQTKVKLEKLEVTCFSSYGLAIVEYITLFTPALKPVHKVVMNSCVNMLMWFGDQLNYIKHICELVSNRFEPVWELV